MSKKLTLIFLFMLGIMGLKAQTTYCYHLYKHYDNMGNAEPRDSYQYITFKDNWLYPSEYALPYVNIDGQIVCQAFLYSRKKVNGDLYYGYFDPKDGDFYSGDILGSTAMYNTFYYLVSEDKSRISYRRSFSNNNVTEDCYELCPDKNCKKDIVPNNPVSPMRR